jgi:molybdate transport system substrate-binding protein
MADVKSQAVNPVNFVTNTMEIATPPSNPARITGVADLAEPGVKLAVCSSEVPCGAVASEVFKNAKITVKPAAEEEDVKSTLAAVESGEVDAGMVYVTDVRSAGDKVKGVEIPDNLNASTEYPISALKGSRDPDLAKAFVDYVLSPAGKNVLSADGFSKP